MSASSDFQPLHIELSGDFTLDLPLELAFPLFSPEGERTWVEGWDPIYLHPSHPSTDPGTVFRTTHRGEETLWLVLEYDPHRAIAAYGRFTPGSRLGTVRVHCHEEGPSVTKVSVAYSLTASAPTGNVVLGELSPSAYEHMMREWHDAIMRSEASYTR